jgi:hypothetical protein
MELKTHQIKRLLSKMDRLKRELKQAETQVDMANRTWSHEQGYRMPLRIEAFRRAINNA